MNKLTETDQKLVALIGENNFMTLKELSPESKLSWLRQYSTTLGNNSNLAHLQTLIMDMLQNFRDSDPMERSRPTFQPDEFDVLINDIAENDLISIGNELGHNRLEIVDRATEYPIRGVMYGANLRAFLPLVVQKRDIKLNVNFLFDCSSPNTYLRHDTLVALGFQESMPADTNVVINGKAITVYRSMGHFENIDLLGQDFMRSASLIMTLNYDSLEVTVVKAT